MMHVLVNRSVCLRKILVKPILVNNFIVKIVRRNVLAVNVEKPAIHPLASVHQSAVILHERAAMINSVPPLK